MEEKLVGDSSSSYEGSVETTLIKYSDVFEKVCPFYMSIGMSYNDFWHGDNDLPKYYLKSYLLKQERDQTLMNYESWLKGLYIYEALCNVAPIFNAFSKKHDAFPYRSKPIPITEKEQRDDEEEQRQLRLNRLYDLLHKSVKKEV